MIIIHLFTYISIIYIATKLRSRYVIAAIFPITPPLYEFRHIVVCLCSSFFPVLLRYPTKVCRCRLGLVVVVVIVVVVVVVVVGSMIVDRSCRREA